MPARAFQESYCGTSNGAVNLGCRSVYRVQAGLLASWLGFYDDDVYYYIRWRLKLEGFYS